MSFWEDETTDQIDLFEAERARRLDLVVRKWFIFASLDYANNNLTPVAFTNYTLALQQYKSLFDASLEEHLYQRIEEAKADYFYNEYATAALGAKAINFTEKKH
jgi:hypothetical protein